METGKHFLLNLIDTLIKSYLEILIIFHCKETAESLFDRA